MVGELVWLLSPESSEDEEDRRRMTIRTDVKPPSLRYLPNKDGQHTKRIAPRAAMNVDHPEPFGSWQI